MKRRITQHARKNSANTVPVYIILDYGHVVSHCFDFYLLGSVAGIEGGTLTPAALFSTNVLRRIQIYIRVS